MIRTFQLLRPNDPTKCPLPRPPSPLGAAGVLPPPAAAARAPWARWARQRGAETPGIHWNINGLLGLSWLEIIGTSLLTSKSLVTGTSKLIGNHWKIIGRLNDNWSFSVISMMKIEDNMDNMDIEWFPLWFEYWMIPNWIQWNMLMIDSTIQIVSNSGCTVYSIASSISIVLTRAQKTSNR